MCSLISFLRFVAGILSTATLCIGGFFYFHHYESLDCGNMKLGITLGITSIIILLINVLTYISACNKKWVVTLCGLFLLGSTGYNIYIKENIDKNCKQNYEDKKIWDYYIYMYVSMIILSVLFIGLVITSSCFKKKNEEV